MNEESPGGGLHIDADWKTEAAREKERLAEEERQKAQAGGSAGQDSGKPSVMDLINMLVMQAAIALGGYQGPGGERMPPNPEAAKHHIDLLELLQEKTKGNLTEDETKAMDGVLYEIRMQYVSIVKTPPPPDEKIS